MRLLRPVLMLLAALVLSVVTRAPAFAIVGGTPDGHRHPYVGTMWSEQGLCSGAAISPTVFLTASHCIDGVDEAYVSFDENPQPRDADGWPTAAAAWTTGTPMEIGDFCGLPDFTCGPGLLGFFGSSDVAVLILDEAVDLPRYAQLPEPDQVDTLRAGTRLTAVGYGVDHVARGGGQPQASASFTRQSTTMRLAPTQNRIDDVAVRMTTTGTTSTCSGDSGSPLLLGDTVLGVLSGSNGGFCSGQVYYSRIDNAMLPLLEQLV